MMLRFHTQTAGVQLTAQQPEVNLVRVAVQGLAAVLGGTQSLHTNSYDEALALPSEKAARLALRTQQVLAYETDVTATVDPFAGSYVVESLTDEVESAALDLMRRVADHGRCGRSDRAGLPEERDRASAPTRSPSRSTTTSARSSGVNRFTVDEEEHYEPLRVDPTIEAEQADRLARLRAERDDGRCHDPPRRAAPGRAGHRQRAGPDEGRRCGPGPPCGEVSDALRDVWGTYTPATCSEVPDYPRRRDHGPPQVRYSTAWLPPTSTDGWPSSPNELVVFRRDVHAHPETARAEIRTTAKVAHRLARAGLEPRVLPGGTGLICDIGTEGPDRAGPAGRPRRASGRRREDRLAATGRRCPGCATPAATTSTPPSCWGPGSSSPSWRRRGCCRAASG